MNAHIPMIESLEGRQFFCASPIHAAAGANAPEAAVTASLRTHQKAPVITVTDYTGTAVNQNNRSSTITLTVTDTNGMRTGVLNVNNNDGGTTPIPFKINSAGTFTFDFSVGDQKVKANGRLSANGQTVSGSWVSVADHGRLGHGDFTASRD